MTDVIGHVGAMSILAERNALLAEYDKAKAQTTYDVVKVEHGHVAEEIFRQWLNTFLPKRFAATKGYIITTNRDYSGPMEEWDVIIYDALESPVLFVRGSEPKRAIPVEYVRAVVEVKATFTPTSAKQVVAKLTKLQAFRGENTDPKYPVSLCAPFVTGAVFFETAVESYTQHIAALNQLSQLYQLSPSVNPLGFVVLRSQKVAEHSGYIRLVVSREMMSWPEPFENSACFTLPDAGDEPDYKYGSVFCSGWGEINFFQYMFDLLAVMKGTYDGRVSSFYGVIFEREGSNLFR
jgi:hypothetical protein